MSYCEKERQTIRQANMFGFEKLCLFIVLFLAFICMSLLGNNAASKPNSESGFSLRESCPKGFELMQENDCRLRSLYQLYDSNLNKGMGGLKTNLPAYRDGFSPQQIDLGRYLFFDPALSGDGSISCATCHQPEQGFADGRARSVGVNGQLTKRSTPSLWNSAFLPKFFWDARAETFEEQVKGPLFSVDEMHNTPKKLLATLNSNETYVDLFSQAFEKQEKIDLEQISTALAAFQASLISLNSRYDEYAHGNHSALKQDEIEGMNVFRSFVARCNQCHMEPLFTTNQIAVTGTPEPEGVELDVGAEKTFASEVLKGGFKVPTLRNITKTAPYMHSGVFENLYAATEFYNKGRGHAVPKNQKMQIHWHIGEPNLSEHEIDLLVRFMNTLSDEKFMPDTPQAVPSGIKLMHTKKNKNYQATSVAGERE